MLVAVNDDQLRRLSDECDRFKQGYAALEADNARLRDLVRELWTYAEQELVCDWTCPYGAVCDWRDCVFTRRMRELGVDE